jgi:hypothetical protein
VGRELVDCPCHCFGCVLVVFGEGMNQSPTSSTRLIPMPCICMTSTSCDVDVRLLARPTTKRPWRPTVFRRHRPNDPTDNTGAGPDPTVPMAIAAALIKHRRRRCSRHTTPLINGAGRASSISNSNCAHL